MRESLCPVGIALIFIFTGGAAEVAPPWQQRPQPWQRRDQPVLSALTTQQAWCKVVVYSPHVIFHEGRFRMWYLGTSTASRSNDIALGYAESADGLKWKEHPRNPILTGKDVPWGRIWQTPFVLFDREEKIYKMWFVSGEGVRKDARGKVIRNDQRLGYATSRDGLAWKVHPQPLFPSGRSPSVIKEGPRRYRMWMGSQPDPKGAWDDIYKNIYEFKSTDGLKWQRSGRPVIQPSGNIRSTVYPFVMKLGDQFHMWYGGHTRGGFEIFHATSADGTRWATDHARPAFPARAQKGFFDSRYTSTPCVVEQRGRFRLYYSARDLKTTYIDGQGRQQKDGSSVYAHIGVALLPQR
jgi:hypothetical protein